MRITTHLLQSNARSNQGRRTSLCGIYKPRKETTIPEECDCAVCLQLLNSRDTVWEKKRFWNIYRVKGIPYKTLFASTEYIGRVRASNQPEALLRAFRKYNITENAKQKEIVARTDPIPFSLED